MAWRFASILRSRSAEGAKTSHVCKSKGEFQRRKLSHSRSCRAIASLRVSAKTETEYGSCIHGCCFFAQPKTFPPAFGAKPRKFGASWVDRNGYDQQEGFLCEGFLTSEASRHATETRINVCKENLCQSQCLESNSTGLASQEPMRSSQERTNNWCRRVSDTKPKGESHRMRNSNA